MKKLILSAALALCVGVEVSAQTPLWQGKGRIALSSDGNEHDDDDWAATPMSLAMLAARGLQDKVVLYTYSDHVWGSNQKQGIKHGMTAYEHMRESALGGQKRFGFENTKFICAVDNAFIAYREMAAAINASSEENPLIIIAAGPMQVVGEGINQAQKEKRKYVTVVSHSKWNNEHGTSKNGQGWDNHVGWEWDAMREAFEAPEKGGVRFVQIAGQNGGKDYAALSDPAENFAWLKTSPARNNPLYQAGSWDWLYSRLESCARKEGAIFDVSDSGMVVYLLTGIDKTNPDMVREIMENPVSRVK